MTGKLAAALCYVRAASNWFYTNIIVEVREFRLVTYGILIVAWHMNCGLWYVNCGLWYKCGEQKWPSDFRAIFEALRLFTTTQIIFYLPPLGLRILKWGETSL